MKFILEQDDIKQALINFVVSEGIDISEQDIDIQMVAGRGENGYSATVSTIKPKAPKKKKATVAAIKNESPKKEDAPKAKAPAPKEPGNPLAAGDDKKEDATDLSEDEDESIFS